MDLPVPSALLDRIESLADGDRIIRVGIDGVDGAGKTTFGDSLARVLGQRGHTVVRAGVDGFHYPRLIRYRRGRHSPEGFYRDSYDYDTLRAVLLDPLAPGGSRVVRLAVHDVDSDQQIDDPARRVRDGVILVFDGIFLHRPELDGCWDVSVFLRVPFDMHSPPGVAIPYGHRGETGRRYLEGQRMYLRECDPESRAAFVIDNLPGAGT